MPRYAIDYISNGRVTGTERWGGKFAQAQEIARKAVAGGGSDAVEIRDANGDIVFRHPGILRRA